MLNNRSLVILATQRSGSTMICDDIAGTKLLGAPSEWFLPIINQINCANSSPSTIKEHIMNVIKCGTTANNIFSVKIMSNQIWPIGTCLNYAGLSLQQEPDDAFYEFFKCASYVRLRRKDKISQAVSRVIANLTNTYHLVDSIDGLEFMLHNYTCEKNAIDFYYDRVLIEDELKNIYHDDCVLDYYIAKFNISCLELDYDTCVDDRNYVNLIAKQFNIPSVSLINRRIKRISGDTQREWVERFRAESHCFN